MSILAPVVYDNGMQRPMQLGDRFGNFDPPIPATDTTNTTLAVTAAMMLSPTYVRNPAGVSTDTYPTADALLSAILAAGAKPNPGISFNWRVINLSANLITGAVTAHTGATMVRGNVAASTTKNFQITLTNVTPTYTATGIVADGTTAVLTGFTAAQLANLSVGMVVTNSVVGLQDATIIGINLAAGTVTMSTVTTSASSAATITFSPTYTITGLAA